MHPLSQEDKFLLLAAQEALLGAVTPNLRSFSVDSADGTILVRAIFGDEPTELEIETMQIVGTEIISNYSREDIREEFLANMDRLTGQELRLLAFRRHEPSETE